MNDRRQSVEVISEVMPVRGSSPDHSRALSTLASVESLSMPPVCILFSSLSFLGRIGNFSSGQINWEGLLFPLYTVEGRCRRWFSRRILAVPNARRELPRWCPEWMVCLPFYHFPSSSWIAKCSHHEVGRFRCLKRGVGSGSRMIPFLARLLGSGSQTQEQRTVKNWRLIVVLSELAEVESITVSVREKKVTLSCRYSYPANATAPKQQVLAIYRKSFSKIALIKKILRRT